MPGWKAEGEWMHFSHLDGGCDLDGAYTIGYRITDDAGDSWTARFNRFKAKDQAAFVAGIHALSDAMPTLLKSLGINPSSVAIVPALGSAETKAAAAGQLAKLATRIAKTTGARLEIGALSKQPHNPIHNIFDAGARDTELGKANYISSKLPVKTVLVVDDLITRGSTLCRIAAAIKAANPGAKVIGIALAKTERRSYWGKLDNNHVAKAWDDRWQRGEKAYKDGQAKGTG
jgi:hypothetical protein